MENPKQAEQIVRDMGNLPFTMSGMPRPIRARAADPEMFDDRPRKPGKRITFRWLDQQVPDFQVAKKLKDLTRKNAAEASFILERQVGEEEKLANQQWKTLKANYKKYELIDGVLGDGTALRLIRSDQTSLDRAARVSALPICIPKGWYQTAKLCSGDKGLSRKGI
ncbi:uncharacterized protein LOC127799784 [Diospyros lotus]|uniref:uncharacterized protein LOC127799784 n=1 Tax=Diospyros lotus TaxID=55363 RepID=UPI00225875CC|nr:uncharacterized protein LOC127799784 [Diospyros lotus]